MEEAPISLSPQGGAPSGHPAVCSDQLCTCAVSTLDYANCDVRVQAFSLQGCFPQEGCMRKNGNHLSSGPKIKDLFLVSAL